MDGRPSSASSATAPPPSGPSIQPLIPLSVIDAPSQRFYAASVAIAIQAWKYTRIAKSFLSPSLDPYTGTSSQGPSLPNAVLLNFAVLFVLSRLGIPRLDPRLASSGSSSSTTSQSSASISAAPASSGRGLTYFKYVVLFGVLLLVDSILLGQGSTNPLVLLLSLVIGFLKAASGIVGVNLQLDAFGTDAFARQLSISEGRVRIRDLIQPKSHILGQHTVHILPYSTARLSPASACYCIGPDAPAISIPVLFNNTEPDLLQYSVTDFLTGHSSLYNVSVTDLIPLPSSKAGSGQQDGDLHVMSAASTLRGRKHISQGLDADEGELDEPLSFLKGSTYQERARLRAQKRAKKSTVKARRDIASGTSRKTASQLLFNLPIHSVGRIRLERVLDKGRNDARLSAAEALVVECPSATFEAPPAAALSSLTEAAHKCPGEKADLSVKVKGLTPLELQYRRTWEPATANGVKRSSGVRHGEAIDETQTISRISSPHHASPLLLPEAESVLSPIERIALARERTKAAARRAGDAKEDYTWAAAHEVEIPLSVGLENAGRYTYVLESVRDACGNLVKPHHDPLPSAAGTAGKVRRKLKGVAKDTPSLVTSQRLVVHPRARVAFDEGLCQPGQPIKMLRTQDGLNLSLIAKGGDRESGPWSVDLHFDPDNSAAGQEPLSRQPATPWDRSLSMDVGSGLAQIQVGSPGTYRLGKVQGRFCSGEVEAPWSCDVVDVPPPTAKITFSSIEDQCAGPVGVKALSILSGSPPFELEYEVQRPGLSKQRVRRRIDQTRDELEFRPNTEGQVTYRFLKLHDANYKDMILDGPTFTQEVHPLATARFAASNGRAAAQPVVVHSCAGNRAQANVELAGTGPWDLTYVVRGAGQTETKQIKKITSPRHTLNFELAPELAEAGGRVTVSLVSIRDGKGCERQLATSDLNIEVKKARSTVGFLPVTYDIERKVEVLDGKQTKLPLRLDGDGPWDVTYSWRSNEHSPEVEETVRLSERSTSITASSAGLYTIKSVRDAYCPGSVLTTQESYRVYVKSRPVVRFAGDAGVSAKNGSLIRPSVCQGRPDAVEVRMEGNFPLQVAYEHQAPSWSGQADVDGSRALASAVGEIASQGKRRRAAFTSAQTSSSLELSTMTPGWHVYTLDSVGDATYAPEPLRDFSRDAPRRLEQMVYPLPSARFVSGSSGGSSSSRAPSFCIGDGLDGSEEHKSGNAIPTVRLSGTPPFTVEFELRDTSASSTSKASSSSGRVKKLTRSGIQSHEYKLRVSRDEFTFETKGKWLLQVTRVIDAHQCEFAPPGVGRTLPASAVMEIEVAETAGIAASSTRDDYCVGETVDFVLQGTPPWTVTYEFEGKVIRAAAKQPEFSRVAEKPGTLTIKSVAHQQNQCKTLLDPSRMDGMVKTIHDLPTVRVSEGRHYIEDLREGNQAEIIFHLTGIPPYSFTYQRTEPADTHSRPKVLETHTVAGILDSKYSIWTSVEGTWSVTWLQDRWCQVSLDSHSGAATPLGKSMLAIESK